MRRFFDSALRAPLRMTCLVVQCNSPTNFRSRCRIAAYGFLCNAEIYSPAQKEIRRPGWGALFPLPERCSAAAAAAVAAIVVIVAAATAAVAEDQQQDDDPPPVVATEAATDAIIVAHKITSDFFRWALLPTFHVMTGGKKGAATKTGRRKYFTEFSVHPPERFCRRFFHPSS